MSNSKCNDSEVVEMVKSILANIKSLEVVDNKNKRYITDIETGLNNYLKECNICKKVGFNDYQCNQKALENLSRYLPIIKDSVYPWKNYDWDYSNFVDNNYSAQATGSSSQGDKYIDNIKIGLKLLAGFIKDPNPNNNSVAGGYGKDSDYTMYSCKPFDIMCNQAVLSTNIVRNMHPQKPPGNDPFFKKNRLDGENASSYYVRVGSCKRPDVKTKKACEEAGYDWYENAVDKVFDNLTGSKTEGVCYSPRYGFLENKPGISLNIFGKDIISKDRLNMKGYVPSVANDIGSLSPINIGLVMQGKNVDGNFEFQPCPSIETFTSNIENQNMEYLLIISILIIVIVLISLAILYFNKK